MILTIELSFLYTLQKIGWFLSDRCTKCGGNVSSHINGRYYCDDCDTEN